MLQLKATAFVILDWQHGVQLKYIGLCKFKKVLQLLMCWMITAVKMNDNMWHGFENMLLKIMDMFHSAL